MTKEEFIEKYGDLKTSDIQDVLMRIASNLSDLHIEKNRFTPEEMDAKLNAMKKYIFDAKDVIRENGKF